MNMYKWSKIGAIFILGVLGALFIFNTKVLTAPDIAHYFLGQLPADSESIEKLSKSDLLILSPDQFVVKADVISRIKAINPRLVILAYVPSQSYNVKYWKDDITFRHLNQINDDWWLRDTKGNLISTWPGLQDINMSKGWSEYLVSFIDKHIANQPNVDGIFFDIINDGISHANKGDVSLNNDGVKRSASELNKEWTQRVKYLLSYARENLKVKYIVINGSSNESFQKYVNGRMFETFPTPWEANGSWSTIMTRLEKNKNFNTDPIIYIFNSNTNNTGKQNDYRKMRFGLASSLLTDNVFYSFDFGDQNHSQIWWYDEYDARIGTPIKAAESRSGAVKYVDDVWKREFSNGMALVNATNQDQVVTLGGEYEKLIGKQDKKINDGSIVEAVKLSAKDGLLLYKTFQFINDVYYPNGTFFRFNDMSGVRVRNGFFSFEAGLPGGAKVFTGDLDGVTSTVEKIVATGGKLQIFDSSGQKWFEEYPYGGNYKGELNIAVGNLLNKTEKNIVISGNLSGEIIIYNYHGKLVKRNIFPMGKKYKSGFNIAIEKLDKIPVIAISTKNEIIIYNEKMTQVKKRFFPWGKNYSGKISIAIADFNYDGSSEIAASGQKQKKPVIGFFGSKGNKIKEIAVSGTFSKNEEIGVVAADVNSDGKKEVVIMSKN